MRSCIVFSAPRAGTHLVMTGLMLMGMKEFPALTNEQWASPLNDLGQWRLLDMPSEDHYRFGAHVSDPNLVHSFAKQDRVLGIHISRNLEDQARSYVAYLHFVQGRRIKYEEALRGVTKFAGENSIWCDQPGVLSVRFERLMDGDGWQEIASHLGGGAIDVNRLVASLPRKDGDPYYRNTVPSKLFYGEGVARG